ncbi:MAG: type III pantothenate kinase [Lentimicrobiaceae bacterium]|nr:type III pantothenate kinase [Lentimicrobiaceae bacterium]MCO5266829.1 type III pantothenate kinase [Lentimicrobium sp.]
MNFIQEPDKLVIDLGNSRVKVATFTNGVLDVLNIIENPTPEKLAKLDFSTHAFKAAIISSVAGDPQPYLKLFPDIQWIVLDHHTPLPIVNKYLTPDTLGKDRIAAVIGANQMFHNSNVLVIDAGTAITYDFVNCKGEYLGGSISPGMHIRFKALNTFTQRLPLLKKQEIDFLTGRNTEESILSGVINGIRLEIDGIIEEYKQTWPNLKTILTGGDTIYFEKILKNNIFAVPNLVLNGLKLILDYNFEK